MVSETTPSLTNITYPGQYSPYMKSSLGSTFYITFAVFLGIAAILYYANQKKMLSLGDTTLYIIMAVIVIMGLFIADRIQYVFNSQGGIMLYSGSLASGEKNVLTEEDTDGKQGSQKGSGIYASYSFWVYDKDTTSANNRFLISRNKYSDKDLTTKDEEGNEIPSGVRQEVSQQPAIYLDDSNRVVYQMIDTTASDSNAIKKLPSTYTVPKHEWTSIQIIQTVDDVSIYMNNRLDSVHTFNPISNPDLIAKGRFIMFPKFNDSNDFNGLLSRFYYSNRSMTPTIQNNMYEIGAVQGTLPFEILKSVLGIPYTLTRSMFV